MQIVWSSVSRSASSLLATSRACSFALRLYLAFTAPECVPLWSVYRTICPLQPVSCASAPVAKAAVTRRPATRTAVGSDAYTLESSARAILSPSEMGGGAAPGPPRVTGRLATYHGR